MASRISSGDSAKANWKNPDLEKSFIDLCIEEANIPEKRGQCKHEIIGGD